MIKNVINYKKTAFGLIIVAAIACIAVGVFFLINPCSDVDEDGATSFHSYTENDDGTFTADNGKTYKYKLELTGLPSNAECYARFVVLSNNRDLTFERVIESIITSNSERFLNVNEAIIISIESLQTLNEDDITS